MKGKIIIYEIPHTRDGNGYDLAKAEDVWTYETEDINGYFEILSASLVKAGQYLDTEGGLIAYRDVSGRVNFFHCHGLTGKIRQFGSESDLRIYLQKFGMELEGTMN